MNDDATGTVFPAERVNARFVVSMSMAKNDIERALRDVVRAGENDEPDFSYRVRLVTGHLVEALDALDFYSQHHEEVRKLIARVPSEAQQHLKKVRSTLQKAGPKVLDHVRDNTFHYPSPDPKYNPTSDEQLRDALRATAQKRAEVFADFEKREVTLTFADDIALALALGKHSTNEDDLRRQLEIARDGAIAFRAWAEALAVAYFNANDLHFGTPEWRDAPPD
jgi:rubrerythrin